ncbi:DUF6580 family putative transport protein [Candidatus Omnitrophota bacterium]
MLILALFILGLVTRLMPHIPNFAPIVAIALFSGAFLNKKFGMWLALALYVITDLIIGMHDVILFTWSSILLISFIGARIKKKKMTNMLGYTLLSSALFFVITNFGVWLAGWYPPTLAGLASCYISALPFFRTSLLVNLIYAGVLVKVYEFCLQKIRSKNLAHALLLR